MARVKTYATQLPDGSIVRWNPLTWQDYDEIVAKYLEISELGSVSWLLLWAAADLCFIGAFDSSSGKEVSLDELPAGTVYIVGRQILENTGFLGKTDYIRQQRNMARARMNTWYESVKSQIMVLFRKTEAEIAEWTMEQFMDYAVRLETVTGQEIPVEDDTPQDPNAPTRFQELPDGTRIPIIDRQSAEHKNPIDVQKEIEYYQKFEHDGRAPSRSQHPARARAERGEKVHPLRQRMINEGMI